ncbi:phospholipase D-like domain-containing protein [Halomonas sp. GFAJ-1]|uniref:phospholipase D-like domain-containing protein n=1 Tax=Halomonas sp. GFAJ-1 TaxID=1118153 RepID=UPI00023A5DE5|nr:phospholipase D-like domain-containing protein [Halomonas sp. GFAJ-1]AVI62554.1 cardiolipin synthase B [Halomonas sp. GFAJ-1]EHK62361.1 phospholipase D/transphosphatidylase [Halomonas sp. GFAJ-1]
MKRRTRLIALTTVVITLLFALGSVLFYNAMPSPKRLLEPVSVNFNTRDADFRRSMGLIFEQPIVAGNRIDSLQDGEAIYAAMLEAIDSAETSITFETFEFWGEKATEPFVDALIAAAERGVAVHALIDYVGSSAAAVNKFERMEEAGVDVIRWRKPSWYELAHFNHRTHRKLLMVDGRTGFIGGANITDNWLPDDDGLAYRDHHFLVKGPVVANMQAAFVDTWLDASGRLLLGDAYFPELEPQGELDAQMVTSTPIEGRHRMRKMLMVAIATAEQRITLGSAYFYPDEHFLEALIEARERGVEVNILVPGDSIDKGFVRHASVNRWRPMLEAGVNIHEYQPSMYHAKLISIDDRWASIGSTNLDNRSFRINKEGNLNVYDEEFARYVRELVEEDIRHAEHYDLDRWHNRPWRKRLAGWVSMVAGAHF